MQNCATKATCIRLSFAILSTFLLWTPNAAAQETAGWRTDGTGRYPSATPPTQWAKDQKVVWSTPMPATGNASPAIVGDKLFVCAEPATLICVNLADGKIAWQKANNYEDVVGPDEVAKMREAQQQGDKLMREIGQQEGQLRKLNNQLKTTPDDAKAKADAEDLKKKVAELRKQLEPFRKDMRPNTHGVNGYSSATPVTDGKIVCAVYGIGVAACYDLAGNRKWAKRIENPANADWGGCASPLLADGKVLVHMKDLVALDTKDGKEAWRAKAPEPFGTPVLANVGGTDLLATAAGNIVRLSDGKVLANNLARLDFCAPILQDGVLYYIQNGGKALKLPGASGDKIVPEVLWQTRPKSERYYASPVLHDGLVYAIIQHGHLSAIDAKTGEVVYEKKLEFGGGTVYPSVTLAGRYLYASSDNGTTFVFEPGREYKEVAKNTLEPFRCSPVFVGKRMYVRTFKNLYCIGE